MSHLNDYSITSSKSEILLPESANVTIFQYALCICSGPRCELEYHRMFLGYISASSKHYKVPSRFLDAVLSLKTEHLLADPSLGEEQTASMMKLRSAFKERIMTFVKKNKLSREACKCLCDILVCAAHICMYLHV